MTVESILDHIIRSYSRVNLHNNFIFVFEDSQAFTDFGSRLRVILQNLENPCFEEPKNPQNIDFSWFSWFFFLGEKKIMLILRFPHSFGVWGCWGGSKSVHFAIFQAKMKDFHGQESRGNQWFRCSRDSKNCKMNALGASPAPPNPKTMRETIY